MRLAIPAARVCPVRAALAARRDNGFAAVILFHTMLNISWFMFPNLGSHYDPRLTALITMLAAIVVTLAFGPRTLARPTG